MFRADVPIGAPAPLLLSLPARDTRATSLSLAVHANGPGRLTLTDLRVQGQTPELAAYIGRMLRFPSPQW